jgi:hypothetical protein
MSFSKPESLAQRIDDWEDSNHLLHMGAWVGDTW